MRGAGTELAFQKDVEIIVDPTMYRERTQYVHGIAVLRQTDIDNKVARRRLEFPDGTFFSRPDRTPGQKAMVLQPAAPKIAIEARRLES